MYKLVRQPPAVGRSRHGKLQQQRVIKLLADGEMSTIEIGRSLGIHKSAVLKLLHRMTKAGLVEKHGKPGRRGFYWRLTRGEVKEDAE